VPEFHRFDQRHYPTVSAREGYANWASSYEATVEDEMDIALLERIDSIDWASVDRAVDLGCGTGRTGAWMRSAGVRHIDGVDLTPEMLDVARARGAHDRIVQADIRATGLASHRYDLAVCCLVDEHLEELTALYDEAARLLRSGGSFVVVGLHPFFIMSTGMPTHFDQADGTSVAVETHIHLPGAHVAAARAAGLTAVELHERLVDDTWVALKPNWTPRRDWPVSYAWAWTTTGR